LGHFKNKIPNFFNGPSITHKGDHFAKKSALKLDGNLKFPHFEHLLCKNKVIVKTNSYIIIDTFF
jgi:hypothetical protein